MNTETPNATTIDEVVTTVDQPAADAMILDRRESENDSHQTAYNRDQHRLRQELTDNIGLPCTDRAPDTDFARSFQNRRQHDVHNADTADQQRDAGNTDHDHVEDHLRLALLLQQARRHDHREIARILMRGRQDRAHHVGRFDGIDVRIDLHVDAVDLVLQVAGIVFEPAHHRVQRRDDHIVAAVASARLPCRNRRKRKASGRRSPGARYRLP